MQRVVRSDFNLNTITDFNLEENDNVTNLYWYANSIIYNKIVGLCIKNNYKTILEIGPGGTPFPLATCIVGLNETPGINYIDINIDQKPLPFKDKEFDFLYCRHVLEDISYPLFAINEMFRVSKNVYIETPSPMVEISRHIDVDRKNIHFNNLRGYFHHKSLVWSFDNTIYILPKAAGILEHLEFDKSFISKIYFLLNNYCIYWNNYFLNETTNCKIVELPFDITSYLNNILNGIEMSINNTNGFKMNYF